MNAIFTAPKINDAVAVEAPASLTVIFHCVAEQLSFFHAATILCMPSQTIACQIDLLETLLGVKLFERRVPSLKLTAAGQTYFHRISPLVENFSTALGQSGQVSVPKPVAPPKEIYGVNLRLNVAGLERALKPYASAIEELPFDVSFKTDAPMQNTQDAVQVYLGKKPIDGFTWFAIYPETLVA